VVSHLFKPYFTGGSEIVAYYQSRRLKEKGFDVKVFAGRHDNRRQHYCLTREKGEFDIARVNLHDRDFDCYSMNYDKPELQKIFHRIIEEVCPDVVHFHNIYSFSLKMIEECTNAHIPTIMILHDYWGICFKNTLKTDTRELCYKPTESCSSCQENFFQKEKINLLFWNAISFFLNT